MRRAGREPSRDAASLSGYAPDRTFGPDDYYDVVSVGLNSRGVRTKGQVYYTDTDGDEQTVSDTRSTAVAKYGTRFIRLDERGGSVKTSAQASALLANILDDLETPFAEQVIEAPFFWPIELGDMYRFSANDEHYDTDQDWAVVGYRHVLSQGEKRTLSQVAGKPAGGYRRWLENERIVLSRPRGLWHKSTTDVSTTDASPTNLRTVTIPGGSIGPNGAIGITGTFNVTGTTATKSLSMDYDQGGQSSIVAVAYGSSDAGRLTFDLTLFNRGSESSQRVDSKITTDVSSISTKAAPVSLSLDTTQDFDLIWWGDVADAADVVTLEISSIEFIGETR